MRGTGARGTGTASFRYSVFVTSGVPRPFSVFWCGIPVSTFILFLFVRFAAAPPADTPPDAA